MTEQEAWLALAEDAGRERARLARGGEPHQFGRGLTHNGLCGALETLSVSGAIYKRMRRRIIRELRTRRRLADGGGPAYLWPLTPSGHKRRAAWARRRAKAAR